MTHPFRRLMAIVESTPLAEAAMPGGDAYWFNPKTGQVWECGDHGERVMEDPSDFGIESEVVEAMESAFPYGSEEHESDFTDEHPEPDRDSLQLLQPEELHYDGPWSRNDAWEQLAMNRGWVRIGAGGQHHPAYLSAATSEAAWYGASYAAKKGDIVNRLDVEISSARGGAFVELSGERLETFLKAGPKRAASLIPLREEVMREKYTPDNRYLRDYLRDEEFDHHRHWWQVCEWLADNDHLDEVSEILGREVTDADDLRDEDPDAIWMKLPENVRTDCAESVIDDLKQHDPVEAPTWAHMSLNNKALLPRNTWLVHFTDDPWGIAQSGFKIGMADMDRLGLTTWVRNTSFDKKHGGYNFAFEAGKRHARWAAQRGKYGQHAVLFQNAGVSAHHYGDEEDQVIFWGADVDPREIVVLEKRDGDWCVRGHRDTRRNDDPDTLFCGDFERAVAWVIQNFAQYRRYLTRR